MAVSGAITQAPNDVGALIRSVPAGATRSLSTELSAMETFIAVVECGSFTGAAARLEMSAVMVGKYIALIERQLNTRLLERNTRRQSLTDAGRVYFDEAKRVLEQVSIARSLSILQTPG